MSTEKRVSNDIYRELGRRLDFQESDHLEASYMGYATRKAGTP